MRQIDRYILNLTFLLRDHLWNFINFMNLRALLEHIECGFCQCRLSQQSVPTMRRSAITSKSAWPRPQGPGCCLRIGTYNIQVDHDRDISTWREWQHRRPLAVNAVAALDCDLLLIQEPGPSMAVDLNADLGPEFRVQTTPCDPAMWSPGSEDEPKVGQAFDGNGFIWRTSRLQLLGDIQTVWLSRTPEQPSKGVPTAWDSSEFCRTMVKANFKDLQTGRTVRAISAHLDHHGETARVESAKLVMAHAHEAHTEGATVVVGGDFNTFPEHEAHGPQTYAALVDAARVGGFVDVRAAAAAHVDFGVGEDSWKGWPGAKFCRAENRANYPDPVLGQDSSRFDQLFVHGSEVVSFTGVVEESSWAPASDHVPIVAEIALV